MADAHAENELLKENESSSNSTDLLKFLSIQNERGKAKIKWLGDLSHLKEFIAGKLKLQGTWSFVSGNGGFHVFKASLVTLSFYPGTKTFNVQGTKQEEIKKLIASLHEENIDNNGELSEVSSSLRLEQDIADLDDDPEVNYHERDTIDSESISEDESDFDNSTSCKDCKENLGLIKDLSQRVTNLESKAGNSDSHQDLLNKIQLLEQQRDSLLITIELLTNRPANAPSFPHSFPHPEHSFGFPGFPTGQVDSTNKPSFPASQFTPPSPLLIPSQQPSKGSCKQASKRNKPTGNPDVVVIGDSMTKHVIGHKLSRDKKVHSASYSGATIQDVNDHAKPFLRRKPKKVIIHVGTNNLRNDNPKKIQRDLKQLTTQMKKDNPDVTLAFSSIIKRKDDSSLNANINKVNTSMKNYCQSNDIDFICNDDIDDSCLFKDGIHLNKKGVFKLASNLRTFINSS